MEIRYCFLFLFFGRVIGQYDEAWTLPNTGRVTTKGMIGVDPISRPEIVESIEHGKQLQCNGNSKSIPPHRINDNYCDCEKDGLDEPSTSACSGVIEPPPFWCLNDNISPQFITASRVNDGVCDCCDGSDEWAVLPSQCINTCKDAQEEARQRLVEIKLGLKKKQTLEHDMANEYIRIKQDTEEKRQDIYKIKTAIMQLQLHHEVALAAERRIRRYDIFDRWSGEDVSKVCVADELSDVLTDVTCTVKQRVPQVKTGTEAGWLQRAQRVKLVGGPMNGLSLEMWLQRQVNAGKKKRSSRYATTAQYKEKTSLLSWIINARNPSRRAMTVLLLSGGLVLSPVLVPLRYLNWNDATAEVSITKELMEEENGWLDGWRSVPLLRRLITASRRLLREAGWHQHVAMYALETIRDLYDPTYSTAFTRGLLYNSDEVTLIGQGILVMQKEADKANKALQQQESELAQFQSLGWLWYPFRNKCYTLKERAGNYNFCPFQGVELNGGSIGKFERLKSDRMLYGGGDVTAQCESGQHETQVLLFCDSSYKLWSAEGHHCRFTLKYGTPLACSKDAVAELSTTSIA